MRSVINIDLLCKLKGASDAKAQEKYLCTYFASIFPCEFHVYFNRVGLQSFFKDQNKAGEKGFKRTLAQRSFIAKQLRAIKKRHGVRISLRKQQKSAYYLQRTRQLGAEELTKLEKCKEVKVFSNKEASQIADFMLKAVQLDVSSLESQKAVMCFLNYALTVRLK